MVKLPHCTSAVHHHVHVPLIVWITTWYTVPQPRHAIRRITSITLKSLVRPHSRFENLELLKL